MDRWISNIQFDLWNGEASLLFRSLVLELVSFLSEPPTIQSIADEQPDPLTQGKFMTAGLFTIATYIAFIHSLPHWLAQYHPPSSSPQI